MGYPDVTISIYPNSGETRIVEFSFTYEWTQTTLRQRSEEVASAAAALVGQDTAADGTVAWLLYSRLLQQTTYRSDGSANVYSALCLGAANSEGIALAYSLLCEQSGITCQLVKGTLDGEPHCWNIITLGDVSWHLDVTRSDPEGAYLHGGDLLVHAGCSGSQEHSYVSVSFLIVCARKSGDGTTPKYAGNPGVLFPLIGHFRGCFFPRREI